MRIKRVVTDKQQKPHLPRRDADLDPPTKGRRGQGLWSHPFGPLLGFNFQTLGWSRRGAGNTHKFPASWPTPCPSAPQANRLLQEQLRLLDSKNIDKLHVSKQNRPWNRAVVSQQNNCKRLSVEKYVRQLPGGGGWCRQMLRKWESPLLTGDQLVLGPTVGGEENRHLGGGSYHGNVVERTTRVLRKCLWITSKNILRKLLPNPHVPPCKKPLISMRPTEI